jgi:hypothetical protein
MKKINLKGIIALSSLAIVFSCKKYDEGPVTFRTPKQRLTDKDWVISESFENGQTETISNEEKATVLTFEDDGKFTIKTPDTTITGSWEFIDDNEKIKTVLAFGNDLETQTSQIKKLTNDELWVTYTQDGDNIEDRYTKKDD